MLVIELVVVVVVEVVVVELLVVELLVVECLVVEVVIVELLVVLEYSGAGRIGVGGTGGGELVDVEVVVVVKWWN